VNHPARVDTFRPDPAVPPDWYRVQSFDFSGSGFDRGHMDPNADRVSSLPVNQATFLMSNMVAQSPDNNQGPWADFENYLRSVVHGDPTHLNEVYIVSGPVGTGGTGSNGGVTTTVAGGHVTVPAYTWKVALVLPDNGSEDDISRVTCSTTTVAVIMPNIQGIISLPWTTYLTTVNAVEALINAGNPPIPYHFFTNLPQPIQNCIKAGTNGVNPKNDQTITFAPVVDQPFGADVAIQATASSGLAVTLAVTSGPAAINGSTLHFTGVGNVTVGATQAGDVNYNAAPPVSQSFNVTPGSQTITFSGPAPAPTYGDAAFQVSATGGASGNPVTLSATGSCTANSQPSPGTITIVSGGVCTVTASQAGSANYNAAPDASETITIAPANATVTVNGFSGTYDGLTHGATGSATGVSNENLSSLLNLGATFTNVPGGTASWTFAGNGSYAASGGSAAIVINRATPSFSGLASLTIEAGTATTTLGGTIRLGALVPTGAIAITLNGVTQTAAIQANGSFSSAFATGLLAPVAAPYAIAYGYAGDANFNGLGAAAGITIVDTTPPTITVPPNITATATLPSGAAVTYSATASDLVDGIRPVVCAPASGSIFPIGTTAVNCSATDAHGNSASRAFTVTVATATVPGTMTGSASIASGSTTTSIQFAVLEGARGTDAGFLIYDAKTRQSGRTQDNVFISALVTDVAFFNAPGVSPGHRPASGIDTVAFKGAGLWNGRSGYTFTATAVDAGEPGPGRDTFAITITDSTGHAVASLNATITSGNIQSLRAF
jgi:DNA/RNA endonuclease G (NUC1)